MLLALADLCPGARVERSTDLRERFPASEHGPALRHYMTSRTVVEITNPCLIHVNNHVVVSHWNFLGGNDVPHPVPIHRFPGLSRHVRDVFAVRGV